MGLLLGMMCNFHCEESLFILNDRNKGFTILENLNKNNNIMDSVHEAMEEAKVCLKVFIEKSYKFFW